MRFFIPPLGTKIKLLTPWSFTMEREHRNWEALMNYTLAFRPDARPNEKYFADYWEGREGYRPTLDQKSYSVVLPADTILKIERIYIRKGAGDFDSVTFLLVDSPEKRLAPKKVGGAGNGKFRFWVKLGEANDRFECEIVP